MTVARHPFVTHDLGDGHELQEGKLPCNLMPDEVAFAALWASHPADKHKILMFGRMVETPRWQQAYGRDYEYTGRVNEALRVPPQLQPLLAWAKATIDDRLNGLLLNWYEGPDHYIGPHHDSTVGMAPGSPIVTVSFGETRTFRLTGKGAAQKPRHFLAQNGTVFVMPWATNLAWKHSVPKAARYTGHRISVTFRTLVGEDPAEELKH